MSRSSGLGRGLGALIPTATVGHSGLITLEVSGIVANPRQPRGRFEPQALQELAQSLREVGMLQPIVVRPLDDQRYQLIAGERRLRAARLAGLHEVPAVVRHTADDQLLTEALVENVHRANLNALEEAAAYQQLLDDFGFTHDALAKRLGKSRSAISNSLRLLSLPSALQEQVASGVLTAGHARAILGLSDASAQVRMAKRVLEQGLSVRATEELVRAQEHGPTQADIDDVSGHRPQRPSPYAHVQRALTDAFATKVEIKGTSDRGKVLIDYAGAADLGRLLAIFGRGTGQDLLHESS